MTAAIERGVIGTPQGNVHYRAAGDGPPLLLLHPNTYSSEMWEAVIPLLAREHRVIAPDRIGHGSSDPMPSWFRVQYDYDAPEGARSGVYPYEDFLDADLSLLDALGIDRVTIVGQSTGAHMAMEIAIAQPERVERLVLMSNSDWTSREQRVAIARDLTEKLERRQIDGSHLLQIWQRKRKWASEKTTPEMMHRVALWAIESMDTWQTLSPAVIVHYQTSERVAHLRQPVLFLDGEHDHQQGIHARRQRDMLPAGTPSEIAVVVGAGYLFPLEEPRATAEKILGYLSGSNGGPRVAS